MDPQLAAFLGVSALLTITPGADTALVLRNAALFGTGGALLTTAGICLGCLAHASLSSAGLSAVLARSAQAFAAVKFLGALYLAYLGARALMASRSLWNAAAVPAAAEGAERTSGRAGWRRFSEGLLTNLLNPKVALFYLTFLPQFIRPGQNALARSLFLGSLHVLMGFFWLGACALCVGRLRPFLSRPRVRGTVEAVIGTVLLAFGIRLALARQR